MPSIGVVGVGRMGLPVCTLLAGAGFEMTATDLDGSRRADVEAAGARWVPSADSLADACEVLVTVLPGSAELLEVMEELLPRIGHGKGWIDLTSASPTVGARLRELAGDVECLDAPMGGGPSAARAGELELFVGGTPEAVDRHRATLETLGRIHHVSAPGAGYLVKLLVNLLWFGQAVATGEALLLARRAELDLSNVRDALQSSAADSHFIRRDADALLTGNDLTDFALDRCCEELDSIATYARELDVPFELSSVVRDMYVRALEHYGPRDGELLAVRMLEERSGISLSSGERAS